jgi:hypothetical protein
MTHPNRRQATGHPAADQVLEGLADDVVEEHAAADDGDGDGARVGWHGGDVTLNEVRNLMLVIPEMSPFDSLRITVASVTVNRSAYSNPAIGWPK